MDIQVRRAIFSDDQTIRSHLKDGKLPHQDVTSHLHHFFVAESAGNFIGCIGLEAYPPAGLLRSFFVTQDHRGSGVGHKLYEAMQQYAAGLEIQHLYLFTESAAEYFRRLGFKNIERSEAPSAIQQTAEFQLLCPATSTCMKLDLTMEKL